eukprot:10381284-Karenia_brevis.AAC.1
MFHAPPVTTEEGEQEAGVEPKAEASCNQEEERISQFSPTQDPDKAGATGSADASGGQAAAMAPPHDDEP